MNILVTGAKGFVGKNLVESLKNIRDGKDRTRRFAVDEVFAYDLDSSEEDLERFAAEADFVFHLAGVNRTTDASQFMEGNAGSARDLLERLREKNNKAPVMLSSSIQASLVGRYRESDYGKSKLLGEKVLFQYAHDAGVPVYVFRFPNLFGKWSRPNYNSVIATFCYNIARDLPIRVDDRETELEWLYIDDLVDTMLDLLAGEAHRCEYNGATPVPCDRGKFCYCPVTHRVTLGEIVDLLETFRRQPETLRMPEIPKNAFVTKLYSTYLSFLPAEKTSFPLTSKSDERGSFTELLKTDNVGQFSVNVTKPGMTKGQHWHHSKWEFFIVVSGHGLIEMREIGTDSVRAFEVFGDHPEAVHMLPGYTHLIKNLSDRDDLVTVMWASEVFDPEKPDTYFEEV